MNVNSRRARWLLLLSPMLLAAAPVPPDSTDARAIMDAVHARDTGDRVVAHMKMSIDEVGGRERERRLRTRSMEFPEGTRSLMLFDQPAEVRNTGLLSIDYDDGARADDQWLFLPALHRTNRIAPSGKSEPFMGTDFSYSDLTRQDPAQYELSLVAAQVLVDGEPCWKIEATPRTERLRDETGYSRMHLWISKEKKMALQVQAWLADGRSVKYLKSSQVRPVDGVWIAHELTARLVRDGKVRSTTVLELSHVRLNVEAVTDADFTQRRLEQGL